MGRPSDYSLELAAAICERLANGESLKAICQLDDMPSKASVYLWLMKHQEFSDMYARAREDQADTLADEIVHIADTPLLGVKTKTTGDGDVETTEGDMIEHRRLQVDARKWVAAKLKPRKYGDKVQQDINHAGKLEIVWTAAQSG
jgi:hypothetical protein